MKKTFISCMLLPLAAFAQTVPETYRLTASISTSTLNSVLAAAVESGALNASQDPFMWTTVKARFISAVVQMEPNAPTPGMRMDVAVRTYVHANTWPFDLTDTRTLRFGVRLIPSVLQTANGKVIRLCPQSVPDNPFYDDNGNIVIVDGLIRSELNKIFDDPASCQNVGSFGSILPDFPTGLIAEDFQFFFDSDRLALGVGIRHNVLAPRRKVAVDYDGDGKADISEWWGAYWKIDYSADGFGGARQTVIVNEDGPRGVPGDYDGDGRTDIAIRDPWNGVWSIDYAADGFGNLSAAFNTNWGNAVSIPVPADYDGDGVDDLAIFNNSWENVSGFVIDYSINGFNGPDFNSWYSGLPPSDHPAPADYDGDGRVDLSLKNDWGQWGIDYAADGYGGWNVVYSGFGGSDFIPAPADFDGDGKADLVVMQKASGGVGWAIDYSAYGFYGLQAWYNGGITYSYTNPKPADYDGDGMADIAVKNNDGYWAIDYTANGYGSWDHVSGGWADGTAQPFHKEAVESVLRTPQETRAEVAFAFDLPGDSPVRIEAFDMGGKRLGTVFQGNLVKGANTVGWSRKELQDKGLKRGLYVLSLSAKGYKTSKKLMMP